MTVIQDKFRAMEEMWREAIETVAYELARHNGESPMDRGAALGRRVHELSQRWGLAGAFEAFKAERAYRGEESGEELYARVEALVFGVATNTLMAA
jgi:hypothetical protein